ncbi:helix-turn-helix domain-containing protein (plasmid) [Paraburkholderia sp. D15]|uniref:helix-turn-helix domain-containing protein n=1 Tax=Paraburkholderia sp. D15 TaxID=2880218 RepID=UPI0024795E70|nr:helix-turn-helix domain-containing protein [Paraburkholderia sp. D15]WGS55257.1 helix-turn-helix domain-containing protein [Paraburkholderia sp. D15]
MSQNDDERTVSARLVDSQDRIDFWLETIARRLVSLEGGSGKPVPDFDANLRQVDYSLFSASHIETNAHWTLRTPHAIRQDNRDSIVACLITKGTGYTFQGTDCVAHAPGDIVIYDVGRPFGHGFHGDMAMTALSIPREIFEASVVPWRGFIKADRLGGITNWVFQQIHEVLTTPAVSRDARMKAQISVRVLDLLRSIMNVSSNDLVAAKSTIKALCRAKTYIEGHLAEESLSWHSVSHAIGISPRHLARVFEKEGITVTRYIWTQRLEQCRADLSDPAMNHIAIGEIALRWGFSSDAHFSRSYRICFGETPTATRKKTKSHLLSLK